MKRDLQTSLDEAHSLPPAAYTDGTVNGTGVDLRDHDSAMVLFHTGVITDGTHTTAVEESDDDATYAAVAAAELQGAAPAIGAADDNKTFTVGYIGTKRYIRGVNVTTGATTGGIVGATVIRGLAHHRDL